MHELNKRLNASRREGYDSLTHDDKLITQWAKERVEWLIGRLVVTQVPPDGFLAYRINKEDISKA